MGKRKQAERRAKQVELLKLFDEDKYTEKHINGKWYIKNFNGNTGNWQVSVYSEQSFANYKAYSASRSLDQEMFRAIDSAE